MPVTAPERTLAQKLTPRIFLALRFWNRPNGLVGFETVLAAASCSTEAEAAMRAAGEVIGDAGFFIETDAAAELERAHGFSSAGRVKVYGPNTQWFPMTRPNLDAWIGSKCKPWSSGGIVQPATFRRVL